MNRKLLQSVREYKKESILAPILVALEVLMEVLIPLMMAKIIDVGMVQGDMGYIVKVGLMLVVMAMLALFFGAKAGQLAAVAAAGYAKNLRHDIFYKIQDFSFGNIDHFSTSSLVTRLTTDITNVQMAYMFTIRLLARAPIMIVLSLVMTVTINKEIALLLLITIPVLGGLLIYIAKKAHPHFIEVFNQYDVLNNTVQENVNAARVVKAYVRDDFENQKFGKISTKVFQLFTKAEKIVAFNSPVMQFTMYAVVLIMVYLGGKSIIFGSMQTGELTSVIVYALQILMSLMIVSFVFVMIMIAEASTERIQEVFDEVPEMEDEENAVDTVVSGDIDFEHVDFSYSGKDGNLSLKDVNLHIKSGQIVGIIGGTGSGKTTLVNLISRFYDASKGTVLLDGQNIENYTRSDLRSRIGVVPQKAALFKGSIRDNLKWGREDASDEDLWQALTTAQGKEVVEGKPGQLDFMLEQNGKNLSGGQKQRLTIARALVKKPEILILDDSASALDFATDAALRKSLNRLDWKVTTFLVSQRSSSIQQADLILVLDNGTLAGKGTHAELLRTCDTYREIYFSQFPEERARYSSVSAGNIMKEVTV